MGFMPKLNTGGTAWEAHPWDTATKRGTTAQRPVGAVVGQQYLDNTLDADGKIITWNGVAWVDSVGAVV